MNTQGDSFQHLGIQLTRRDFISISAVATASVVSDRIVPQCLSDLRRSMPFRATLVALDGWRGERELFGQVGRSLSTGSSQVIILCLAAAHRFSTLIDERARVNGHYSLRRLLIHRPLDFGSINRTLDQIHCDSEDFIVDGWELSADKFDSERQLGRALDLALNLISRTRSPVVSLVPAALSSWRVRDLTTVARVSNRYKGIKFVFFGLESLVGTCPAEDFAFFRNTMRSLTQNLNIYFPLEGRGLGTTWGIDSARTLRGQTYSRIGRRLSDCAGASECGYLGINAANLYTLHTNNYGQVCAV